MVDSDRPIVLPLLLAGVCLAAFACQPEPEPLRTEDQAVADGRPSVPERPTRGSLAAAHDHGEVVAPTDPDYGPVSARAAVRDVAVAQMLHRLQNGTFTDDLEALDVHAPDLIALHVVARDSTGFSVVGSYSGTPPVECALRYGVSEPPRTWVRETDKVVCG